LIFIGNLLAIPLIRHFGNEWLSSFAYRTNIKPIAFISSIGITLLLSFILISYQIVKTARINPIKPLKYE